jgi:hypothetical protein
LIARAAKPWQAEAIHTYDSHGARDKSLRGFAQRAEMG